MRQASLGFTKTTGYQGITSRPFTSPHKLHYGILLSVCFNQEVFLGVSLCNPGMLISGLSYYILYADATARNLVHALGGHSPVSLAA